MQLPYILLTNFFLTCLFVIVMRQVGLKINLVDVPGGRKQHQGNIPLVGGIAMFFGFLIAVVLIPTSVTSYYPLLLAAGLLVATGAIDDFYDISAKLRLIAQFIAMMIIILVGKVVLFDLGNLLAFGNIHLGFLAIPFTLFATLSLINAVNMMDGLDGLAGSLTLISLLFMLVVSLQAERFMDAQLLLIAMTTILAFLCFNFPLPWRSQAKVFMGDAGSLFLGCLVAWFSLSLTQGDNAAVHPVIMLWFLAIPLFDLATVFTIRIKRKQSPLEPSRDHLHYHLMDKGFSRPTVLLLMCLIAFVMGLIGLVAHYLQLPDYIMLLLFIAIYICYLRTMLKHRVQLAIN